MASDDWVIAVNLEPQIAKVAIEVAQQMVNDVKSNANSVLIKGYAKGVYASGWTYRVESDSVIVYNDGKHSSLAHLLEYGHRSRSGGNVSPQPHIRPAYTKAVQDYENKLKQIKIELEN